MNNMEPIITGIKLKENNFINYKSHQRRQQHVIIGDGPREESMPFPSKALPCLLSIMQVRYVTFRTQLLISGIMSNTHDHNLKKDLHK